MEENEKNKMIINEYDYSNIIPTYENIYKLIRYCEKTYNQLLTLSNEEQIKNEPLKYEYRNYMWKKTYRAAFSIHASTKNYKSYNFSDSKDYTETLNKGYLNDLKYLKITLNLCYERGMGNNIQKHTNEFEIAFYPYEISFIRNSNIKEENMDIVEESIKNILNEFETVNTIFCTK